jgi:hypothetical protein
MHADASQPSNTECPRCGYDIAAAMQAAKERGDERVICSECGLETAVRELELCADCPPWLIESRIGRDGVVLRFYRTVTRALRTHRFWSALRMSAPISRRGLVAYFLALAIVLHLLAVAAVAPIVVIDRTTNPNGRSIVPDVALVAVLPLCPLSADEILYASAQANPNRSVDAATLWRAVTGAVRLTIMRDKLWFEFTPQDPNATGAYAIPQPKPFVLSGPSFIEPNQNLVRAHRWLLAVLAISLFPVVACGLLCLLPASLRRERIRGVHLFRGCAYACSFAPFALILNASALGVAAFGFAMTARNLLPGIYSVAQLTAIALMIWIPLGSLAFSARYLDAFCTRYLLLARGRVVAITLNLITLLAAVVIAFTAFNA